LDSIYDGDNEELSRILPFTKQALDYNGVWTHIAQADKKGSFQRKILEFKLAEVEPDTSISQVLMSSYPWYE